MGYNKILVPLDGTNFGELALEHLPKIANTGATVCLLSVLIDELVSVYPPLFNLDSSDRRQEREVYLQGVATPLKALGFNVTIAVQAGTALDRIAEVADDGFDLVLLATHRRSAVERLVLGSVSSGILRKTLCPVLIV